MTDKTSLSKPEPIQPSGASAPAEEPTLRCNRCGKPTTPQTAVLTPTGYRCKECIRGQQKNFDTTTRLDVPLSFLVSALIAFAGSWLVPRTGFITLLLAPGVGLLIFNAVRLVVNRRRGRALNQAVLWGAIAGSLPLLVMKMLPLFSVPGGVVPSLAASLPLIWQTLYSVMVATSAFGQFTGIKLR